MLDLILTIFLQILVWLSWSGLFLSMILMLSLLIILSDSPKVNERGVNAFITIFITGIVSLSLLVILPSNSYLSKLKKGIENKLLLEYSVKDKK